MSKMTADDIRPRLLPRKVKPDPATETLQRVIRIETRLSKLMEHVGLKADGTGPLTTKRKEAAR